jgi:hypothetical protein
MNLSLDIDKILDEAFEKVFGRVVSFDSTVLVDECSECLGSGFFEKEVPIFRTATRDVAYIDTRRIKCPDCLGDGVVPRECIECEDELTLICGVNSTKCEDCL